MIQLDTLALPDNFLWVNEFDWSPVAQSVERSLTGAFVVSESQKSYGRSIILGDGENSWLTRTELEDLLILSEKLSYKMSLTLPDTRIFTAIFDRSNGSPLEVHSLFSKAYPASTDFYAVTIRLLTTA